MTIIYRRIKLGTGDKLQISNVYVMYNNGPWLRFVVCSEMAVADLSNVLRKRNENNTHLKYLTALADSYITHKYTRLCYIVSGTVPERGS